MKLPFPQTAHGQINYDYMEEYIDKLKKINIKQLKNTLDAMIVD